MNNAEPALQIPFRANVIHGSIGYDKESTYIYIPSSSTKSSNEKKKDECRSIKFFNQFDRPLIIYNATTDKSELVSQHIKVNHLGISFSLFSTVLVAVGCRFTICLHQTRSIGFAFVYPCSQTIIIISTISQSRSNSYITYESLLFSFAYLSIQWFIDCK